MVSRTHPQMFMLVLCVHQTQSKSAIRDIFRVQSLLRYDPHVALSHILQSCFPENDLGVFLAGIGQEIVVTFAAETVAMERSINSLRLTLDFVRNWTDSSLLYGIMINNLISTSTSPTLTYLAYSK